MKNRTERENGWKRACVLICAFFLLAGISSGLSAQHSPEDSTKKRERLTGEWNKSGLSYTFEDTAALTVTRLEGRPGEQIRGPYAWFTLGTHDCFSFRKNPADSLSLHVVLVGEVTDSTAVLALGVPFVRSGTGFGLQGTWNHAETLTRIEWAFGDSTVIYRKFAFDILTGREAIAEEHRGTWKRAGTGYEPGSCEVMFGGNDRAVVLPMVYRDMMYLFDLSPGKSLFIRGRSKPPTGERLTKIGR